MSVPAIPGAAAAATPAPAGAQAAGLGALDSQAFLKLLVAQLRYQNPLAPSDPSAMLGQTAQFTQVESLQALAATQAQLSTLSQTGVASGLVGRQVSAVAADGSALSGVVEAVRFSGQGPVLVVGGAEVPLAAVSEVRPQAPPTA